MIEHKNLDNTSLKHWLCYIPLVALVMYFTEANKTTELKKHIKYWIILFAWYIILQAILGWLLSGTLFLVYLGISGFLFFKGYQGQDINIEIIDNLEKKIKNEFGSSKK